MNQIGSLYVITPEVSKNNLNISISYGYVLKLRSREEFRKITVDY